MASYPTDSEENHTANEQSPFMMESDLETVNAGKPNNRPVIARVNITRQAYTQETLVETYGKQEIEKEPLKKRILQGIKAKFRCSGHCLKNRITSIFPFIGMLMTYQWKKWIVSDIIAGISVGVIHIPQGMGFAVLTNLQPVYGLYASIFPVWFYFLFGTSRHISIGTMAVISLLIGAVVEKEVGMISGNGATIFSNETDTTASPVTDAEEIAKVDIAMSISLLMGVFQFAMWLFRLDVISTYMSMPFNQAFMTGAASHIITSQVSSMLGLSFKRPVGMFSIPKTYIEIFKNITQTNIAALVTSVICIIVLLVLKMGINDRFKSKMKAPIPAELIVVVVGTLISHFAKLNERYDLKIVGDIPLGIPTPRVPSLTNASHYIVDAFILAVLGFVISLSMAKIVSKRQSYSVNPSQEILAYSVHNAIGAMFNSFGGAQAPPRTLVCESTSGKTQLAGLISSILPLLVCVALGPLFSSLPFAVLAAIIAVALLPLMGQFSDLPMLWRISKVDFVVWIATATFVIFFSIELGLVIGIGVNLLLVTVQAQLASAVVQTVGEDRDIFCILNYGNDNSSSVLVHQMNSNLYFANVEIVKKQIIKSSAKFTSLLSESADSNVPCNETYTSEVQVEKTNEKKIIVLDCSAITFIDLMGVNLLKQLRSDLLANGVIFVLASCKQHLLKTLGAAGALQGETAFDVFPTVQDAVAILDVNNSSTKF